MKKNDKLKGSIILLLGAIIWGYAFLYQKNGLDHVGPFTLNGARALLAAIILIPTSFIVDKRNKIKGKDVGKRVSYKKEFLIASLAGVALFISSSAQEIGLTMTTASKSAFITSTYIIFVPIIGLFMKKSINLKTWICVFIALIGSYILSLEGSFIPSIGDLITLICALFFAVQILIVDAICKESNALRVNGYSFLMVAILSIVPAFTTEEITIEGLKSAAFAIFYLGFFSGCLGYSMQIIGQKYTNPVMATLIMSLESIFALITGVIFLNETLVTHQIIGCILIFGSVVISQIDFKIFKKKKLIVDN